MIQTEQLGRYECIDYKNNHRKFWHIIHDVSNNRYMATWGRIGNKAPPPVYYDAQQAAAKIKDKLRKGYQKKEGYKAVQGSVAVHFILSLCDVGVE